MIGDIVHSPLAQWLSQTKEEDPWTGFLVVVKNMLGSVEQERTTTDIVESADVSGNSESTQVKVRSQQNDL